MSHDVFILCQNGTLIRSGQKSLFLHRWHFISTSFFQNFLLKFILLSSSSGATTAFLSVSPIYTYSHTQEYSSGIYKFVMAKIRCGIIMVKKHTDK